MMVAVDSAKAVGFFRVTLAQSLKTFANVLLRQWYAAVHRNALAPLCVIRGN